MKNMAKLLLRDIELTMDNVTIMFDSNNVHETDPLIDSIIENVKIIIESANSICEETKFMTCIKVIDRHVMFYEDTRDMGSNIVDLQLIVDSLKEIFRLYKLEY